MSTELAKNSQLLRAVLQLLILDYERQGSGERIELVLAASGLGYQEIADLLGKKPDAVRMLLKRSRTGE